MLYDDMLVNVPPAKRLEFIKAAEKVIAEDEQYEDEETTIDDLWQLFYEKFENMRYQCTTTDGYRVIAESERREVKDGYNSYKITLIDSNEHEILQHVVYIENEENCMSAYRLLSDYWSWIAYKCEYESFFDYLEATYASGGEV